MQARWAFPLLTFVFSGAASPGHPPVRPNPNLKPAGVLRGGVLTVTLEAKQASWRLDGPGRPAMTIEAFSEPGQPPLLPGPLLRAPQGTGIRVSVKNSLPLPLTFFLPTAIHGGPALFTAADSIVIAPGAVGVLSTQASVPGNYAYRATIPTGASKAWRLAGLLGGGLVIDTAGGPAPTRDRVFVIMQAMDSAFTAYVDSTNEPQALQHAPPGIARIVYTINGESWPRTERIAATAGDSLHWRVINAAFDAHPMHLHGFFYRVDAFSGPFGSGRPAPGQMVVTQLMTPFSGMSMTWAPDRPGDWLFHCHFALHLQPDSYSAAPDDPNHRDMTGLALGVNVAVRKGTRAPGEPTPVRHLRLIAVMDSAPLGTVHRPDSAPSATPLHQFAADSVPWMHFILEEHGRRVEAGRDFSPELDLTRGVPVSIMIVNHLSEPTSVHWHGIEVEDSYVDGVPGFSGLGKRLSPAIAPGDSFEARFTPPRAGTFMYHAHVDETREQLGGLEGALIVRDRGDSNPTDDHVFFLKGLGKDLVAHPREINGQVNPDTVVLHVGRTARLRLLNLSTADPSPGFRLTARPDSISGDGRDAMLVSWRPVAKDGFDLPAALQVSRPANQIVSMGETYDFEYTPTQPGTLHLEVHALHVVARVPIRVE